MTINEMIDSMLVKAVTGEDYSKKMIKWSSPHEYIKNPDSTYMAACHAIIRGDQISLTNIMKTACEYRVEHKVRKFGELYSKRCMDPETIVEPEVPNYIRKDASINIANHMYYVPENARPLYAALAKAAFMAKNKEDGKKIASMVSKLDKLYNVQTNIINEIFTHEKEAEDFNISPEACKKVLGEEDTKKLFPNGVLNINLYNTLPKKDKELILKYMEEK